MNDQAPPDNAESIDLLDQYSDCRQQTAQHVATIWAAVQKPSLHVLDFGAGDGGLLSEIVRLDGQLPEVTIIEPDAESAALALRRLRATAVSVQRARDLEDVDSFDVCLAAHVLYYVDDLPAWMEAISRRMALGGAATSVLTDPSCAMFALRGIVRRHTGRSPRITRESLVKEGSRCGLASEVTRIESTFEYGTHSPLLSPVPSESEDPRFARFVCWLTRLDAHTPLDAELNASLNEFFTDRYDGSRVRLDLRDVAVHMTHAA